MEKVMVGYDKSESSEKALELGIDLAGKFDIPLVILYVRTKYERSFIKDQNLAEDEIKKQMKEMLAATIKKTIKSGVQGEGVILKGDPATKILSYSEEQDVDLIILGPVGIGSTGKYQLGSVAEKVMRYSNKPVMIAR
jgi:nucleotide-binding universal stress UspA family protein